MVSEISVTTVKFVSMIQGIFLLQDTSTGKCSLFLSVCRWVIIHANKRDNHHAVSPPSIPQRYILSSFAFILDLAHLTSNQITNFLGTYCFFTYNWLKLCVLIKSTLSSKCLLNKQMVTWLHQRKNHETVIQVSITYFSNEK